MPRALLAFGPRFPRALLLQYSCLGQAPMAREGNLKQEVGAMDMYSLTGIVGLLAIAVLSALAARAEQGLRHKTSRRDSSLRTQQQITIGKAHCR
jgi:hypothetical protein